MKILPVGVEFVILQRHLKPQGCILRTPSREKLMYTLPSKVILSIITLLDRVISCIIIIIIIIGLALSDYVLDRRVTQRSRM
jgi:hypothetical protein